MDITLEDLETMFHNATIESDYKTLAGRSFRFAILPSQDSVKLAIIDSDTWETIVTIDLPATVKTTLSF